MNESKHKNEYLIKLNDETFITYRRRVPQDVIDYFKKYTDFDVPKLWKIQLGTESWMQARKIRDRLRKQHNLNLKGVYAAIASEEPSLAIYRFKESFEYDYSEHVRLSRAIRDCHLENIDVTLEKFMDYLFFEETIIPDLSDKQKVIYDFLKISRSKILVEKQHMEKYLKPRKKYPQRKSRSKAAIAARENEE